MFQVPETPFHHWLEITYVGVLPFVLTGIGVLLKLAFTTSKAFTELKLTVVNIRDNHLAHLSADVAGVKEDIKEVRGQLFDHIQKCN
jgi:hypothetical protein